MNSYNNNNSKNGLVLDQSAGNLNGTSETIRGASSAKKSIVLDKDLDYVAGVLDGDGNFDVRTSEKGLRILKSIRIKMSSRDIRVLSRVKRILGCGSIRAHIRLPTYHISTKVEMRRVVELLNGRIRLKTDNFAESCKYFGIEFKEADYVIPQNSTYLTGLIDTDGSVTYNFQRNVVCLDLEIKQNIRSEKLDFSRTILGVTPKVQKLIKRNQTKDKIFYSIRFVFCPSVDCMIHIYNFAMKSRNYSDFKFYRLTQVKPFLEVRRFKSSIKGSDEHKIYSKWVLNFVSHLNPNPKLSYLNELTL
jgi:hypothetical protein